MASVPITGMVRSVADATRMAHRLQVATKGKDTMTETDLYSPIVAGMNSEGFAVFKIADGSVGKKPFDVAGVCPDGISVAIEIKIEKQADMGTLTVVPVGLLSGHQSSWLLAYARRGAHAALAVYYTRERQLRVWVLKPGTTVVAVELHRVDGKFIGWADLFTCTRKPSSAQSSTSP
jgi:Holliday junction resolvase